MTEINVARIKDIVQRIENHRRAFDMVSWHDNSGLRTLESLAKLDDGTPIVVALENIDEANTQCGTTLCIAGFAVMAGGWKMNYEQDGDRYGKWVNSYWVDPQGLRGTPDWIKDGAEMLGLDPMYASRLFHYTADNDEALEALVDLSNGVPYEDIYILTDESDHCDCTTCKYPNSYVEDYCCEECTARREHYENI